MVTIKNGTMTFLTISHHYIGSYKKEVVFTSASGTKIINQLKSRIFDENRFASYHSLIKLVLL